MFIWAGFYLLGYRLHYTHIRARWLRRVNVPSFPKKFRIAFYFLPSQEKKT